MLEFLARLSIGMLVLVGVVGVILGLLAMVAYLMLAHQFVLLGIWATTGIPGLLYGAYQIGKDILK